MAVRFMTTGRNRPISLRAAVVSGDVVECVVKPWGNLTTPPLEYMLEWLGAMIAHRLGVRTPQPYAVRVGLLFVGSIDDSALRDALKSSSGRVLYGSKYIANDYIPFVPSLDLSSAQRAAAALIVGFDAYVHNPDRRLSNPNMFMSRDNFLAFDHELAFSFIYALFGPAADTDAVPGIVQAHAFRAPFSGTHGSPLNGFQQALEALNDEFFDALKLATPPEWTEGSAAGKLDQIVDVLRRRRDAAAQWLPQVQACLTG